MRVAAWLKPTLLAGLVAFEDASHRPLSLGHLCHFFLATTINYVDRQVFGNLAPAAAEKTRGGQ
jgi:hypothetical protein